VLEFTYFPPPHNQWTTSELLLTVLERYNLHTKIRSVTSDSGGEMPPAMRHVAKKLNDDFLCRLGEEWHIRCVCHIMNRAVNDCQAMFKEEVSKLRAMLKTVRGCVPMRLEFKNVQVRLVRSKVVQDPNLDVETRWNSMFLMIDGCYGINPTRKLHLTVSIP
jgi:hypothetical protein